MIHQIYDEEKRQKILRVTPNFKKFYNLLHGLNIGLNDYQFATLFEVHKSFGVTFKNALLIIKKMLEELKVDDKDVPNTKTYELMEGKGSPQEIHLLRLHIKELIEDKFNDYLELPVSSGDFVNQITVRKIKEV
jgi:hypothetical protein